MIFLFGISRMIEGRYSSSKYLYSLFRYYITEHGVLLPSKYIIIHSRIHFRGICNATMLQ